MPFWRSIAEKINEYFSTRYTGAQVKTKWKNLLHKHLIRLFKLITNYYVIMNVLIFFQDQISYRLGDSLGNDT